MSTTQAMDALVYEGPWKVGLRSAAQPVPSSSQALVRVHATGICGTDLGIISGAYPARPAVILGHEAAGTVVQVGEQVDDLAVGDRVVIDPTYACGACRMCRTGRGNHCLHKPSTEAGVSCDGAFAPYYCAEARSLHRLADSVGFDEAVLVEPLSCALTGVSRLRLRPDLIAVVIGGGPMGVLCAYALSIAGLQGAIVERSEHRRVATVGAVPSGFGVYESLAAAIAAVGWQGTCDVAVDTTGTQAQEALSVLAPGGQVLAMGLGRGQAIIDPAQMANRSISLIGSIDSLGTFAAAAHLVTCGRVPAPRILSASFPLADFKLALADLGCDLDRQVRGVPSQALKLVLHP